MENSSNACSNIPKLALKDLLQNIIALTIAWRTVIRRGPGVRAATCLRVSLDGCIGAIQLPAWKHMEAIVSFSLLPAFAFDPILRCSVFQVRWFFPAVCSANRTSCASSEGPTMWLHCKFSSDATLPALAHAQVKAPTYFIQWTRKEIWTVSGGGEHAIGFCPSTEILYVFSLATCN